MRAIMSELERKLSESKSQNSVFNFEKHELINKISKLQQDWETDRSKQLAE